MHRCSSSGGAVSAATSGYEGRPLISAWQMRSKEIACCAPITLPDSLSERNAERLRPHSTSHHDSFQSIGDVVNDIIALDCIRVHADVGSWQEAITVAGQLLVEAGHVTDKYIAEMISAVETYGPYIVIAPGLALAHARPASSVLRTGISLATFAPPVEFGSEANDPVGVVVALCATDHQNHLQILAQLSTFLGKDGTIDFLRDCSDPKQIHQAINQSE